VPVRADSKSEDRQLIVDRRRLPIQTQPILAESVYVADQISAEANQRIRVQPDSFECCSPTSRQSHLFANLQQLSEDVQQLFEHKQRQVQEEQARNEGGELVLVDASTTESEDQYLVFRSTTGGPLHSDNLGARNFKSILKRAGLPNIRLYDLRHTHATLLLLAGEHPKVVSERLGHASVTITMDTYCHVMPTMQRAAAEKIERLLACS
jgi:integrase